jgi:hypothetical protein
MPKYENDITVYCAECGATHRYVDTNHYVYGHCDCSPTPVLYVKNIVDVVMLLEHKRRRLVIRMHTLMDVEITKESLKEFPCVVDKYIKEHLPKRLY